jgi:phosphoribosylaminoimidazole carboxylase (NCAIR synthetase)
MRACQVIHDFLAHFLLRRSFQGVGEEIAHPKDSSASRSLSMESSGKGAGPTGMIKHRQTGEYYKGNGQWTIDRAEAMQFDNLSVVVNEARAHSLEDCCEFVVEVAGQVGFRILLPL